MDLKLLGLLMQRTRAGGGSSGPCDWYDITNKPIIPTEYDIMMMCMELDMFSPIIASENTLYTDNDGRVFIL